MWSARNSLCLVVHASQGEHFSIACLSKQSLNSRNWVFRTFQCSVQRSAVYTESYAILSRRLVHDGGSAHPCTGLSYFLKDSLMSEIFYFCNKVVLYREGYLSGSSFVRRDVIPCEEV